MDLKIQERPPKITGMNIVVTEVGYAYQCKLCSEIFRLNSAKITDHLNLHLRGEIVGLPDIRTVFRTSSNSKKVLIVKGYKLNDTGEVVLTVLSKSSHKNCWIESEFQSHQIPKDWIRIEKVKMTQVGSPYSEFRILEPGDTLQNVIATGLQFIYDGALLCETKVGDETTQWLPSSTLKAGQKIVHEYNPAKVTLKAGVFTQVEAVDHVGESIYMITFNTDKKVSYYVTETHLGRMSFI